MTAKVIRFLAFLTLLEVGFRLEYYLSFRLSDQTVAEEKEEGELRILCLGDSISKGYPKLLRSTLKAVLPDYKVNVYRAFSYRNSPLGFAIQLNQAIERYRPDIVISMIGLFDISERRQKFLEFQSGYWWGSRILSQTYVGAALLYFYMTDIAPLFDSNEALEKELHHHLTSKNLKKSLMLVKRMTGKRSVDEQVDFYRRVASSLRDGDQRVRIDLLKGLVNHHEEIQNGIIRELESSELSNLDKNLDKVHEYINNSRTLRIASFMANMAEGRGSDLYNKRFDDLLNLHFIHDIKVALKKFRIDRNVVGGDNLSILINGYRQYLTTRNLLIKLIQDHEKELAADDYQSVLQSMQRSKISIGKLSNRVALSIVVYFYKNMKTVGHETLCANYEIQLKMQDDLESVLTAVYHLLNFRGETELIQVLLDEDSYCGMARRAYQGIADDSQGHRLLESDELYKELIGAYRLIHKDTSRYGARLAVMQYPNLSIAKLQKGLRDLDDVIFIDNERIFDSAIKKYGRNTFFHDTVSYGIGHMTFQGNQIFVQNIIDHIRPYLPPKNNLESE